MKKIWGLAILSAISAVLFLSCGGAKAQMTPEQIAFQKKQQENSLLAKTVRKPGSTEPYAKGIVGGTWMGNLSDDPKSFNPLHAQDGETAAVTGMLQDALLDYDAYTRKWKANAASYEVKVNKEAGTMDVIFTLRDDLYWTTLADPSRKVKVTSDDVVFWYNKITGNPDLQQSEYAGHFIEMPDGTKKPITIEKIDDRKFVFHYPRIISMPELSSNMTFGPKYVFQPVLEKDGVKGVMNLWAVNTDPKTIPSMGPYYIESYKPGVSVTLKRNPNYWRTDTYGQHIPYVETYVLKIIPTRDLEKLKFLANDIDGYQLRSEDLKDLVDKSPRNYTVYYGGPSLGAAFISWNQNPTNLAPKYVKWFSNEKFRQAMSTFFDRARVVKEVYRGLGEPDLGFFAKPNPYYDPKITQTYTYDPARGKKLLAEIGIKPNKDGKMQDSDGNLIEYTLEAPVENNVLVDIANIYADDLKKVGITLIVKPVNFQKLVASLMQTYDWQAAVLSFGSNYWPIGGNNVWLSSGNLHLWHPLQKKPATAWEAQIDKLYNEGYTTRDPVKAKKIYDQYQRILLDQLPLMYMIYPDVFEAYRDKWANIRVDNLQAPDMNYVYLKK